MVRSATNKANLCSTRSGIIRVYYGFPKTGAHQERYCIHQKDETLPKDSRVVEEHAISEWSFTEHAKPRGYGSSSHIVKKSINTSVISPAFVRSLKFHSEKAWFSTTMLTVGRVSSFWWIYYFHGCYTPSSPIIQHYPHLEDWSISRCAHPRSLPSFLYCLYCTTIRWFGELQCLLKKIIETNIITIHIATQPFDGTELLSW